MNYLEAITLGLIQGLTEFLPVSSSAHLRIVPDLFGWNDPGASFSAVVQLGTVAAVLVAFSSDLQALAVAAAQGIRSSDARHNGQWRQLTCLAVGSIPIVIAGVVASDLVEGPLRNMVVIAAALVAGSWWLWSSTRRTGSRTIGSITTRDALLIGVAQVAALVPGVSRSGATIGAGYRLGLAPDTAARYSFLLSVPAVVAAGLFGLTDVRADIEIGPTAAALLVAFGTGWLSIRVLLQLVTSGRFGAFVTYRLALAVVIITTTVL